MTEKEAWSSIDLANIRPETGEVPIPNTVFVAGVRLINDHTPSTYYHNTTQKTLLIQIKLTT